MNQGLRTNSKVPLCTGLFYLFLAVITVTKAAIFEADLGGGLAYVHLSDASLVAKHAGPQVVDLRFTEALEESAGGLAGRLRDAAGGSATLFVLINSATDPVLRIELAKIQGIHRSILFVGPATEELAPEITVSPDLERDRRACDALAAGVPPAELINEKLEKPRFDEAHLARSRINGNPDGTADTAATTPPADPPKAAGPKDLSLQRAVFLHRALLALGRIPPSA